MNKSLICITSLYVKCCQELILIMSFLYWFKNKSKALHHTCKKEQGKEKKQKNKKNQGQSLLANHWQLVSFYLSAKNLCYQFQNQMKCCLKTPLCKFDGLCKRPSRRSLHSSISIIICSKNMGPNFRVL